MSPSILQLSGKMIAFTTVFATAPVISAGLIKPTSPSSADIKLTSAAAAPAIRLTAPLKTSEEIPPEVSNLLRSQQPAPAVNFFDPKGQMHFRLGECVDLRGMYSGGENASGAGLPFFREEYVEDHTTEFQDPRSKTHMVNAHTMKSNKEMWGVGVEMPFVPLEEAGVPGWLSGGVSHNESSSKTEQSLKFNVASYAMSNVRSLKHHEGGFQEKDLQVSFNRLQCTHYVKEIHTGAALTAEINLSSSVDMWSSETKASLSGTMGGFLGWARTYLGAVSNSY